MAAQKTNAMRALDRAGIAYDALQYDYDESDLSGVTAAGKLGLPVDCVFKTLVARGERRGVIVCLIPVHHEIDLKKLAKAACDKRVELIHLKELLPLTGYERGGCSPLAMKKAYSTFIDSSALAQRRICVSAGQRGRQIMLDPCELVRLLGAEIFDNAECGD